MSLLNKINGFLEKPKLSDFYFSFSQIHNLLDSGIPIQSALTIVGPHTANKMLGNSFNSIARYLQSGFSTSEAFGREKIFPPLVSPILAAGDISSQLSNAFYKLSEFYWLNFNLYAKIRNALLMPKIAATIMTLLIIAYIKFAIPEYAKLYEENQLHLPKVVEYVSAFVNAIVDYWPITLIMLYLIYQAWMLFKKVNSKFIDRIKLKLPIYKELHFYFLQHQMVSVLELMLSSGLKLPVALNYAANVVENSIMKHDILEIQKNLLNGYDLATAFKKNNQHGCFDKVLIASIDNGQKSEHMVLSLHNACRFYERVLDNMIEPISTKISIMVMVPVGLLIIGVYLFSMAPMLNYFSQLSKF